MKPVGAAAAATAHFGTAVWPGMDPFDVACCSEEPLFLLTPCFERDLRCCLLPAQLKGLGPHSPGLEWWEQGTLPSQLYTNGEKGHGPQAVVMFCHMPVALRSCKYTTISIHLPLSLSFSQPPLSRFWSGLPFEHGSAGLLS